MKKTPLMLAAIVAVPALLGGCAQSGASAVPQTSLTISVTPGADLAALHVGLKQGFFKDEGITLTINSLAASPSAVLTAVSTEAFDLGYADAVSIMSAREQGLAIDVISGAAATSGNTKSDYAAIIVPGDSPFDSMDDLQYRFISVDAEGTINDLVARNAVEAAGGAINVVNWRQVPFADATEALDAGSVDAALVVEPFVTQARSAGYKVISYPYAEFDPELTVSGYVVSSTMKDEKPELVERFVAALEKSHEFAASDDLEVRKNIGTYIDLEASVRSRLALPVFTTKIERGAADKLGAAAVKYGFLTAEPDFDEMLP